MNKLLRLLGLLLLATPLQAAPDVHSQLAQLLHEEKLQGAVWTTLEAQGAAGLRDAGTGAPMRFDDRVQVGSIAKTVLATGILRMVSEGRLALDAPVATVLPGIRFDNPWEASDPVRIRHLLDHTAGLDDVHLWHVFTMRAAADTPLAAAFRQGSKVLRVRQRPGTRFSYSNSGYTLLGMVIEAITGQAYEPYLDATLLARLGMHDSSFAFVTQERDPRLASGHFEDGATHPAVPSYVRPAAQFTTTAADMGRFARFLMSDGSVNGKPFIDTALLRQMGEPAGTEAARAGLSVGYGLGLRRYDRHWAAAKCHGGNTVGFRAKLCLFPDTQQAFFIAINADSETADYARFDALLTRTLKVGMLPAPFASPHFDSTAWEGWYVPAPNRFDSFRLLDTVFNPVHISGDGHALKLVSPQSGALMLRHAGGRLFRGPDKLRASHVLLVSAEGRRVLSTGTQSYEQVSLAYLALLWISIGGGVLGLTYILIKPLWRLARRRTAGHIAGCSARRDPLWAPFAGALALLLPLPFFYHQSFMRLGELTLASGLLAAVTGALPVAMLAGLAASLRAARVDILDAAAMLAVLQLCLVLAAWGLLPLRLWA
ncbi:serine hydrolase [Massilia sp. H6]|uniref:serine hydrolase domain-containing protein n=1 Tax=Massilia sp. H6 TaxID=2970464 RepID=UPI002169C6F0|nr:serine hydrolase domain-containing protein [Massilia sp. H6]UVW28781.1 beta-lactamase family protein [Massilia sp. H6]